MSRDQALLILTDVLKTFEKEMKTLFIKDVKLTQNEYDTLLSVYFQKG